MTCPKCSHTDVAVLYVPPICFKNYLSEDFLRLTCNRCSYVWTEKTHWMNILEIYAKLTWPLSKSERRVLEKRLQIAEALVNPATIPEDILRKIEDCKAAIAERNR